MDNVLVATSKQLMSCVKDFCKAEGITDLNAREVVGPGRGGAGTAKRVELTLKGDSSGKIVWICLPTDNTNLDTNLNHYGVYYQFEESAFGCSGCNGYKEDGNPSTRLCALANRLDEQLKLNEPDFVWCMFDEPF